MKLKKVCTFFYCIGFFACIVACVKDVDFDQIEDVVLTPVYEVDFIYSKFDTSQFIDSSIPPTVTLPEVVISDTLNYDLLGTDFVVENLEQVILSFEFRNTIEREFTFSFGFLNDSNQRIGSSYTVVASAGEGSNTDPVLTSEVILLDKSDITTLSAATKLITEIRVQNVNVSLSGVLELKSKGTYFITYEL
ncbi:hypothetical protein J8281_02075 [Aquimarina sp. U1-2]|uniref:hypothetical protein n=1 Tax=Aquimarina sp. U1-2 TaxID=2823141 RepID=UPI001AECB12D|nr:hypothetical protein [Aquimarina sp. U1-2]MBP2830961.1 hypothetical protein [Aquimarina sp. U1-2]